MTTPPYARPPRQPRSSGSGWACACHGAPRSQYVPGWGWRTIGPADTCPWRYAVIPAPPPAGEQLPRVLLRATAPPLDLELPRDVPGLSRRLWALGVANTATYALAMVSRRVPLDGPDATGRTTADVPGLLASLALRALPFGVATWVRHEGATWKTDAAWIVHEGKILPSNITEFKQHVKELEERQ